MNKKEKQITEQKKVSVWDKLKYTGMIGAMKLMNTFSSQELRDKNYQKNLEKSEANEQLIQTVEKQNFGLDKRQLHSILLLLKKVATESNISQAEIQEAVKILPEGTFDRYLADELNLTKTQNNIARVREQILFNIQQKQNSISNERNRNRQVIEHHDGRSSFQILERILQRK
jgi:hypothetical protein